MDTPQVNKQDPEECDACIALNSLCDWHDGWSVGCSSAMGVIQWTLDNIEGVARMAAHIENLKAEADENPL